MLDGSGTTLAGLGERGVAQPDVVVARLHKLRVGVAEEPEAGLGSVRERSRGAERGPVLAVTDLEVQRGGIRGDARKVGDRPQARHPDLKAVGRLAGPDRQHL
jgi:hypothetical protein